MSAPVTGTSFREFLMTRVTCLSPWLSPKALYLGRICFSTKSMISRFTCCFIDIPPLYLYNKGRAYIINSLLLFNSPFRWWSGMIQCRNRRCSELFCLEFCSVLCLRLSFSFPYRFCCAERYRVLQTAGTCCWLHAEIRRRWWHLLW